MKTQYFTTMSAAYLPNLVFATCCTSSMLGWGIFPSTAGILEISFPVGSAAKAVKRHS